MQSETDLHYVPVNIAFTGPANVGTYFKPQENGTSADGCPIREAVLRGRKLVGTNLNLPDGFCGSIISQGLEDAKGDKQWKVSGNFSKVSLWNHEAAPSKTDNTYRWKEWLEISEKMHSPVSEQELDEAMKQANEPQNS